MSIQGLSILEIITSLTAVQLLMLGTVLLSKENIKRLSNRILSVFMFSNALLLIFFLTALLGIYETSSVSFFYYLLGPLMYLYVRSMCEKHFRLGTGVWRHGLIFVLMFLYVAVKLMVAPQGASSSWNYWEFLVSQIVLHIQIAIYVVLSLQTVLAYRREIKNLFASIEQINLTWLLLIILFFTSMWVVDFVAFTLDVLLDEPGRISYYLLILSISINLFFTNYLVYRGLRQADAFNAMKAADKYARSRISEEEGRKMAGLLKEVMHGKKPYLNPEITIRDLSEYMEIHPKSLSQLINSHFSQNFYDFINTYRIQEAKEIMNKNADEKMTILEILYEVGFNSKSAFNHAFKKNTGKTPSEFKKQLMVA